MDDSHTDNIKWNKQYSKEYILYDFIYSKFKNRQKKLMMLEVRTDYLWSIDGIDEEGVREESRVLIIVRSFVWLLHGICICKN